MRGFAVVVLLELGVGGTGLLALLSHATGGTIRTRAYGGGDGLELPADLDLALIATALGALCLGLGLWLGRKW
jgi:hypothetical protein